MVYDSIYIKFKKQAKLIQGFRNQTMALFMEKGKKVMGSRHEVGASEISEMYFLTEWWLQK